MVKSVQAGASGGEIHTEKRQADFKVWSRPFTNDTDTSPFH